MFNSNPLQAQAVGLLVGGNHGDQDGENSHDKRRISDAVLLVQKQIKRTNLSQFPGGGLGKQNPARTIAHWPPGVKETINYWLREKAFLLKSLYKSIFHS